MAVRAKFYVSNVTLWAPGNTGSVVLAPVTRGEDNREWSSATPSGKVEMSITNPEAFTYFKDRLGKELFLTFTDSE